ncbi:MAG: PilZ domain-containing protein [Pirellulales bacterium]
MLDIGHEKSIIEELWLAAEARVKLPMLTAKYFFEPKGAMPNHFSNRRSFHRFYLRSKAILTQGDRILGAYTTDVSRQGIGFLSPVQLMPKGKWKLRLPTGAEYELRVTRCRRESENCYACGGRFSAPIANV